MKYKVTLEIKVLSIDVVDVEVTANSREEAIRLAEKKYKASDIDYASIRTYETYEPTLDEGNMDVNVEELDGI